MESLLLIVGGANVPALNDLLEPFGVVLGGDLVDGEIALPGVEGGMVFQTGTGILAAPPGSWLFPAAGGETRLWGRVGWEQSDDECIYSI